MFDPVAMGGRGWSVGQDDRDGMMRRRQVAHIRSRTVDLMAASAIR
jgi:hypothetical protein